MNTPDICSYLDCKNKINFVLLNVKTGDIHPYGFCKNHIHIYEIDKKKFWPSFSKLTLDEFETMELLKA
jgi:hypothetical protein